MTYTPDVRVEVAFGLGPYDVVGPGDWVDITEYVLDIRTKRGRPSEFDRFSPGTATVRLLNDQRQFDPLNTAGDYYGDLTANVPIRIVAEVSAVDYPVFRGFVDGWPATYTEGGFHSEVEVSCTDGFKLLAERPLPDTHYTFLTDTMPGLEGWYPCDSRDNDTLTAAGTKGRDGRIVSPLTIVDPLVATSTKAIQIPEQKPALDEYLVGVDIPIVTAADLLLSGNSWTVALVCQFAKRGFRGLFSTVNAAGTTLTTVYSGSDGYLNFIISAGAFLTGSDTTVNMGDGLAHRVVLVRSGTSAYLYIDGILRASDTDAGATGATFATGGVHRIGRTGFGDGVTSDPQVSIDSIMTFNTALTAAEVVALDAELLEGFATVQTSGAAVEAVLDLIGWPAALRAIDTGEMLVRLPVNPKGESALSMLSNIAATEQGRLFIDASGNLTFHGRDRFIRETVESTVQYTFSDTDRDLATPPDVGILDGTLSITVDDRLTFDAASITRAGGRAQTAGSTTPARTYSATGLHLNNDQQALSLAQFIAFRYGTALPRSEAWDVDPEIRPADWADILDLEVGHRIKHDLTPGGIGSSIDLEQHVEFIAHDIDAERWTVTLNGSPVDPNGGAYFLWASVATADPDNGWADTSGTPNPGGYWG